MKLTRTHKNLRNKITETVYFKPLGSTEIQETTLVIRNKNRQETRKQIFINGVNLIFTTKTLKTDWKYAIQTDFPYLQMRFELNGNTRYTSGNNTYFIGSNEHAFYYFPALNGELTYAAGTDLATVEIEISLDWLKRILHNNLEPLGKFALDISRCRPSVLGGKCLPISREMRIILTAIDQCKLSGPLKKIFIEGKLLELMALQVGQLTGKANHFQKSVLKKADRERIHYIKDLISDNMHTPYSIHTLADIACMNRTKLQEGFKAVFGTTIYGYLANERMNKAHELLVSGEYPKIAEIARRIGFKNPNHFSTAFRKKFGYLPKDIQK